MSDALTALPWLAAVSWPMLVAMGLASSHARGVAMALAPWAALPALVLAVAAPAPADLPWLLLGARFELDDIGCVFLMFTATLWLAAGVYARQYLDGDPAAHRFFAFFLVAMAGNVGLIAAGDAVLFYTCFALMSFASYGVIVHAGDREALHAGRVYITLVIVGELLIFAGLLSWAGVTGGTRLIGWTATAAQIPGPLVTGLLLVGFGIKAGAVPLHVWLPLAHPVAPTPASAVLSGAMIKAGLLGWIRFLPLGEAASPGLAFWCMAGGLGAAFGGAVAGVLQDNPKVTLAYSSISQMGLMTVAVGAGLAAPEAWPLLLPAVVLYATHHALAKGALFLGAGVAQHPGRSAGARRAMTAGLVLPALAMAGAPFTSGALAKLALKDALPPAGGALALLLSIAAIGSTLLMARFVSLALASGTRPGSGAHAGIWMPWALLTTAGAVLAVGPMGIAGLPDVAPSLEPGVSWSLSWPVAAGLVVYWTARRLWPHARSAPRVPAGDVLWVAIRPFETFRIPVAGARTSPALPAAVMEPLARVWSELTTLEKGLTRWHTTGLLLLLLLVALTMVVGG